MHKLTAATVLTLLVSACAPEMPPPRLPARPDVYLVPDSVVASGLVPINSTLEAVLLEQGLRADEVYRVIDAVRAVFDPRRLRSRQPFSIEQAIDGGLRRFEYEIDADSSLRVTPEGDEPSALRAEVVPIPKTLEEAAVSGSIDQGTPSLFQSLQAAGEQAELAVGMAQILSGEIDFNSDLQPGDAYSVAFERFTREGGPSSYGAITAAEFQNNGRVIRAIRFAPEGGEPGYYDEEGRSLRRFFLKSPLKFEPRITSRFSFRRIHPILGSARAHRGVDYGAPTGAEVVSVASGRVLSVTSDATNGRMVRIRHASGYISSYLHLSAFARGIRAGGAVAQGQIIGRVGSTGLATGPHLHYGLQKNGVYVDPLREHRNMPPGDPVPASDRDAFLVVRDRALEALAGSTDRTASTVAPAEPSL